MISHASISARLDLPAVFKRDKGFWNVVSIHEPTMPKASVQGVKRVHYSAFDDVDNAAEGLERGMVPVRTAQVRAIFDFANETHPQGLLIQCRMGQSRSTGIALALIVRGLVQSGEIKPTERAVELLLQVRRQAMPNALVLQLALESFISVEQAKGLTSELVNHPRLMENRFLNRRSQP